MSSMRITPVFQTRDNDCALACLTMILQNLGKKISLYELKMHNPISTAGLSILDLKAITQKYDLNSKVFAVNSKSPEELSQLKTPFVSYHSNEHYVVVEAINKNDVEVIDPKNGRKTLSIQEFLETWSSVVIYCQPDSKFEKDEISINWRTWFPPKKQFRNIWIALLGLSVLLFFISWLIPYTIARTVSYVNQNEQLPLNLRELIGAGIGFVIAYFILAWYKGVVLLEVRLKLDQWLNEKFVSGLIKLPTSFFSRFPLGDLLDRISSVSILKDFVSNRLAASAIDILLFTALTGFVLYASIKIGIIFLVSAFIIAYIIFLYWKTLGERYRDEILSYASMYDTLSDTILGIHEIKACHKENSLIERWRQTLNTYLDTVRQRGKVSVKLDALVELLSGAIPVIVFFTAMLLVYRAEISIADAALAYLLIQFSLGSLVALFSTVLQFQNLIIHTERINGIADFVSIHEEKQRPVSNMISPDRICIEDCYFRYTPDGPNVLQNINLALQGAGIFVITGQSGSGKSTLLKLMAKQLQPIQGKVFYSSNNNTQENNAVAEHKDIISVIQNNYIFSGSILDNITMFSEDYSMDEIISACKIANIHDEILAMSMAYNTILERDGINISGGQRQRVTLARAIYQKPTILLLDEFTSNLDKRNEDIILNNIRQLNCLVVVATHRTSWIRQEDKIINIDNGVVNLLNPHEYLKSVNADFKELNHA